MEHFQTQGKNKAMICMEVLVELEIHFEVEDDFRQKTWEIYFHHFLVEDFEDKVEDEREEVVREEVRIWNMIYI